MLAAIITIIIGSLRTLVPLSTTFSTNCDPRSRIANPVSLTSFMSPLIPCPTSSPGKDMGSNLFVNSIIYIGFTVIAASFSSSLYHKNVHFVVCKLSARFQILSVCMTDFLQLMGAFWPNLWNFDVLAVLIDKFQCCVWCLRWFDSDTLYRFSKKVYFSMCLVLVRLIFENNILLRSILSQKELSVFNGSSHGYNLLLKKLSIKRKQ